VPYIILSILIKLTCIVHIMRTGRNTYWIWIVLLLPAVGPLAYFIVEVWPELAATRTARDARNVVGKAIAPNKDLKAAVRDYEMIDTVENMAALAEQCLDKEMFNDAQKLFQQGLAGVHSDDPELLQGLARAEFGLGNFTEARKTLTDLRSKNPKHRAAEIGLLMAMTLEALDEPEAALREYEAIEGISAGPETNCRHALLLKRLNQREKANRLFADILKTAKHSDRRYRSTHKEWIRLAKAELGV